MISHAAALRIVLIGSVGSSRRVLQGLLRHQAQVVGVLGLSPAKAARVSGYCRLDDLAREAGAPHHEFVNVNDEPVLRLVESWSPDLLFVVGLSQLVKRPLLALPRLGCVGFHPTRLPQGRGRAPVAWLALGACPGAATFFLLDAEADAGPLLVQEPFPVAEDDYAHDIVVRLEEAIDRALERWLPQLLAGEWNPQPQDETQATYLGRRAPADGLIDWAAPAHEIQALVRAASHPHPGAYTYVGAAKLVIWRAEEVVNATCRGVVGRILLCDGSGSLLVQTGAGVLKLTSFEYACDPAAAPELRAGLKLGVSAPDEIYALKARLQSLEKQVAELTQGEQGHAQGGIQ